MSFTIKTILINVVIAAGPLLLGRVSLAQDGIPIPDPVVAPETDLTPTAESGTLESIPPGRFEPTPADAAGSESPMLDGTAVVEGDILLDEMYEDGDGMSGGFPSPAICEICGEGEAAPPLWSIKQDVRVLSLGRPAGKRVSLTRRYDPNDPTLTRDQLIEAVFLFDGVLSTRTLTFDVAAGYSTTIGRHLGRDAQNRDHFLEFTYWGMQKWDAYGQAYATGQLEDQMGSGANPSLRFGNLYSPFPAEVRGFNRANQHWILQESRLNSYELNIRLRPRSRADRMVLYPNGRWRRQCQPGAKLSYLFGLRVLTFDESFRFQSTGLMQTLDARGIVTDTTSTSGEYLVRTHNDLVGLQIGFDYIFRECKWNWGFHGKTGPYVNFADQVSRIVTDAAGDTVGTVDPDRRTASTDEDVSLLVELGVEGTYKIRPNLSVRASYDIMWMVGMARAAEQLQFSQPATPRVYNDAVIFSHGLSLGIECLW